MKSSPSTSRCARASWSNAAWTRSRARARAVAHRRPRTAQTDLRRPRQKARSRDATDTAARGAQRRRDLRVPADEGDTRLHARRGPHAGARHRRQQRDLCARGCDLPPAAALHDAAGSAGHAVGALSQRLPVAGHATGLLRLGDAEHRPSMRWRRSRATTRHSSAPTVCPSRCGRNS